MRRGPGTLERPAPRGRLREAWRASVPWLLLAGAVSVRVIRLAAQGLWFDETYTVFVARLPLREAWAALVADGVHPPLYYALTRLALVFGESEVTVRLPSVLLGAASVPMLFYLARRWAGERAALFASVLLMLSPLAIWYSREARMYALLGFIFIACMLTFDVLLERWTAWRALAFILAHLLAYLTHYFALLVPVVELVYLAIRLRSHPGVLIRWIWLQALAAIPLLAWAVILATRPGQYFGIGWIPVSRPLDLLLSAMNFTFGSTAPQPAWQWAALAGCGLVTLLGFRYAWDSERGKAMTALWAGLPIVITFLASLRRPVYMDRFLVGSLPALLLLIAVGLVSLRGWRTVATATLLTILFAWSAYRFVYQPGQAKEQWREAAAYLGHAGTTETIVPRVAQILVPLSYYYSGTASVTPMEFNRQVTPLDRLTDDKSGAWLVYWSPAFDAHRVAQGAPFDPQAEHDPQALAWLSMKGPRLIERVDLTGITLLHFSLRSTVSQDARAGGDG